MYLTSSANVQESAFPVAFSVGGELCAASIVGVSCTRHRTAAHMRQRNVCWPAHSPLPSLPCDWLHKGSSTNDKSSLQMCLASTPKVLKFSLESKFEGAKR